MAKNYIDTGTTVDYTAGADISSGDLVDLGDCCGVALEGIANGSTGAVAVKGKFATSKATGVNWTVGTQLYFGVAGAVTDASGTTAAGKAGNVVVNGDTTCVLLLNL